MDLIQYPKNPSFFDFTKYPALSANWKFSYNKIIELNREVTQLLKRDDISIVVAGSYGRMDACEESDLDFIRRPR